MQITRFAYLREINDNSIKEIILFFFLLYRNGPRNFVRKTRMATDERTDKSSVTRTVLGKKTPPQRQTKASHIQVRSGKPNYPKNA